MGVIVCDVKVLRPEEVRWGWFGPFVVARPRFAAVRLLARVAEIPFAMAVIGPVGVNPSRRAV
jgi:hypothetical protein